MKKLVLVLLFLFIGKLNAGRYYVNSISGNNYNSGLDTSHAWQSIAKVDSFSFGTNDTISFKCGQTFSGYTLIPKRDYLTFNSYSSGTRPVIDRNADTSVYDPSQRCVFIDSKNNINFIGISFIHGEFENIYTFKCNYITFDHCNIDASSHSYFGDSAHGQLLTELGSHFTARYCTFNNSRGGHGIYINATSNALLEYDTIQYNRTQGINIGYNSSSPYLADSLIIRYCVIKKNKGGQIYDDGCQHSSFYYNVIENSTDTAFKYSAGIQIVDQGYAPNGNNYYNNSMIVHQRGIAFEIGSDPNYINQPNITNMTVKNNIINVSSNTCWSWVIRGNRGNWTINNNMYYVITGGYASNWYLSGQQCTGFSDWRSRSGNQFDLSSKVDNPVFTSDSNYTLQNSSPAVLSGVWVNLNSPYNRDIIGTHIDNPPDIGAYQNASYLSGTIPTTTLNGGNIAITGNVTSPYGTTLTILNGAKLWFAPACSLLISGHLYSYGTSSIPVIFTSLSDTLGSSWGTITIDTGSHGSYMHYCNIQYGKEIDIIRSNNVTIQNCNIKNSSMHGLNFSYGTGCYATNDSIKNTNTDHGIIVQNSAYVYCTGNTIVKTDSNHTGIGIYFGGGAMGVAAQNDIRGFSSGISIAWGSSPTSTNPNPSSYRNNRITNCSIGIEVYRNSYPVFGPPYSPAVYGYNSIHDNTINASIGMNYPTYACSLWAEYNFWGWPLNTSKFQWSSAAYFNYSSNLSTDPWAGIPYPSINQISGDNSYADLKNQTNSVLNTNMVGGADGSISHSSDIDSVFIGMNLFNNNNSNAAKDYYISYLKQHPDNQAAYTYLYSCADSNTTPEIINFFNSLPLKASKDQKLLLAYLYDKQGNIELAKNVNSQVIKENLNTSLAVRANLNNFYIALYGYKDLKTATSLLNDVKSQASLSTQTEISLADNALNVYGAVISANTNSQLTKQAGHEELPTSYFLSQNYPNPFNPTSTIRYQIPAPGLVTLKVYDILGREVAILLNETKAEGSYDYSFDASRFASGVYIYQLRVNDYVSSKKMVLLK